MNRVIDKFAVAIDDLEPKIGKLERARAVFAEYQSTGALSRATVESAHEEATGYFLDHLDNSWEPTQLGKEIDSRLMAPLEQLMLVVE